jgi:hypothetical protein
MWTTLALGLAALSLTACTLHQDPVPEVTRADLTAQTVKVEALQQEVELVRGQVDGLDRRLEVIEPLPARMAILEALQRTPKPTKSKGGSKPVHEMNPLQLVTYAQKEARVLPTEAGFFGKSGEHVYSWVPGKVFTILLAPTQQTGIFLPPGERAIVGLLLDKEEYEVHSERAGLEGTAYDAIFVRPKLERGEVDAAIVTESGRRYLLHFIVGKVGMLAVTFETPQMTQARSVAPKLVLPRPPQ